MNCRLLAIAPRWIEHMKLALLFTFLFSVTGLFANEGKELVELLRKGNAQHDVGNYEQALAYYYKALKLDSISGIVHYEIAYTLLAMKRYDEAADYSRKVISLDSKQQQGAYLMLGSALSMSGKLQEAIQAYLDGLVKFRGMHQLHYNLALAYFDIGNLSKSEEALYRSLQMRPGHINSHILLGKVAAARGDNIKSVLCFSYVLYLNPEQSNVQEISTMLKEQVTVLFDSKADSLHVGLFAGDSIFADLYKSLNAEKTEDNTLQSFPELLCKFFHSLESVADKGHPLWSDLYAGTFYSLHTSGHCEAYAHSLTQLNEDSEPDRWVRLNQGKVQEMRSWIEAHQPPQKMNQILFGGRSTLR